MPSSVKAWLIIIVLAGTAGSLAGAEDLRGPETFSSITNPSERSRALFVEAGRVIQHPRCLNCHPVGERPTQGNDSHPHSPLVVRGPDDKGAIAMRCTTCHQDANYEPSRVPGHPLWHVAPKSMAWQTKSLGQICEQIKDPRRNGGARGDPRAHGARLAGGLGLDARRKPRARARHASAARRVDRRVDRVRSRLPRILTTAAPAQHPSPIRGA
jgi:hypothetical protein